MGIPSSLSHIKGDGISDTLGLSPQDSKASENVMGGVHNRMFHFDLVVEFKINLQSELHQ